MATHNPYKVGSSPQKQYARAFAYSHIKRPDFYHKFHIVIASREMGDIRFLTGSGVQPDRIIACDTDPDAMRNVRRSFPTVVRSPHNDICSTVAWAIEHFGYGQIASINVDLCLGLVSGTNILNGVLNHRPQHSISKVFFTFCRRNPYGDRKEEHLERFIEMVPRLRDRDPIEYLEYNSFSREKIGSPMAIISLF